MQPIFYNSIFVKDFEEPLFNYRLFLISKYHFSNRSGLFAVDELHSLLNTIYRVKDSSRQYHHRLKNKLSQSSLFRITTDGRFCFKAWPNYDKHKLPVTQRDLSGNRAFLDGVIGACLINGGLFCSYSKTAASLHITDRRIRQAVVRLMDTKRIHKQNNFLIPDEPFQKSKHDIYRIRRELFNIHGIATPEPVKYKSQYLLGLYLPSAFSAVVNRHTDAKLQPPRKAPARYELLKSTQNYNLWMVKKSQTSNYNLSMYLNDYGFKTL